jgi:hypothetical protein
MEIVGEARESLFAIAHRPLRLVVSFRSTVHVTVDLSSGHLPGGLRKAEWTPDWTPGPLFPGKTGPKSFGIFALAPDLGRSCHIRNAAPRMGLRVRIPCHPLRKPL